MFTGIVHNFHIMNFTCLNPNTPWYCRLCNETILAFNHIDDDSEFQTKIKNFVSNSLYLDILNRYQDSEIFDPFELNLSDNDNIVEYQCELVPARTISIILPTI